MRSLELQTVTARVEDFENLISLLIKENSTLKLDTLLVYPYFVTYCPEENRCYPCCNLISTFLSKNISLRQVDISLPFHVNQLISCISIIQSGLDQNLTLEKLTVNKEIMFKRNEHTAKIELVQGRELYASQSNQANAQDGRNLLVISQCMEMPSVLPQLGSVNIHHQTQCEVSSYSPYMDGGNSLQTCSTKRVKIGSPAATEHPPTANSTGCFIPVPEPLLHHQFTI